MMKRRFNRLCQENIFYTAGMTLIICMTLLLGISAPVSAQEMQSRPEAASEKNIRIESQTKTDAEARTYTDQQGVVYTLSREDSCFISGYTETIKSAVKIPVRIKKDGHVYKVKGIGKSAFRNCTALKQIEAPNSVTGIAAGAFSGCRNLKSITVLPAAFIQGKSGKTSLVTVKINGALLSTKADVKLEIGRSVIQEAASNKKTDAVTLRICVTANSNYPATAAVPDQMTLQQKAVKALAKSGKDLMVRVRDAKGGSYDVKAGADGLKQTSGNLQLALGQKDAGDISGTTKTDLKKALRKNGIDADKVKILTYSLEQGSGAGLSIVFSAKGVRGAKSGSKVYLYRYDRKNHVFAAASFHPYTVSKKGNITMSVMRGGVYVATKKPFRYMSRQPANEFLTESGSTYYIDKNGAAVHGWKKIGGAYYYFDRENGKMAIGGKVDGIKLRADGTAVQTDANVKKIQTMIKARAVVEQVTAPSDSKSQKIEKCFRWIFQFPYRRYRRLSPICRQPGWEVTFANDIFDNHQGCCVSEAAAAAFLFHECGYKTVYVATDTGHAWVELNGRVYDPLFAEARGFSRYYNVPYDGYGMWAVIKRKI